MQTSRGSARGKTSRAIGRSAVCTFAFVTCALAASFARAQNACDTIRDDRDQAEQQHLLETARTKSTAYIRCLSERQSGDLRAAGRLVDAQLVERSTQDKELKEAQASDKNIDQKIEAQQLYQGFNWGVGLGYSFGMGGQRVESAEVVNGVLRVQSDVTDQPRLVLELHAHLKTWPRANGALLAIGPFASIQTAKGESGGDSLSSFAVGVMFGIQDEAKSTTGWNLGVGYVYDSNVQLLGRGLEDGQPLPTGETEVRFRRASAGGVMVMFSRQFGLPGTKKED